MNAPDSTTDMGLGIALVTGSTSGIGRATAIRLAEDGWNVVVHGRNSERGADVVREIEAQGGRARFVAADLKNLACGAKPGRGNWGRRCARQQRWRFVVRPDR